MTRTHRLATPALLALIPIAALTLSACDWVSSVGNDTEMKNVEILPGTASDEMITLDQANGDGTAIDTSTAIGPAQPKAAGDEADAADGGEGAEPGGTDGAAAATDDSASTGGDTVIRPPAGGAEPDRPARPATPAKK